MKRLCLFIASTALLLPSCGLKREAHWAPEPKQQHWIADDIAGPNWYQKKGR